MNLLPCAHLANIMSSNEEDDYSVHHRMLLSTATAPPRIMCCRACQFNPTSAAPTQLIDLCAPHNRPLLRKLRTCVDTHIDIADGRLPRHLCPGCAASVEAAYRFRIRCEYIDQQWRDSLLPVAITFDDEKLAPTPPETFDVSETVAEVKVEEVPDEHTHELINNIAEPDEFIEEYIDFEGQSDGELFDNDQPPVSIEVKYGTSDDTELLALDSEDGVVNQEELDGALHLEEYIDDTNTVASLHEDDYAENNEPNAEPSLKPLLQLAAATDPASRFRCDTCAAVLPTFTALNEHKKSHGKQRYQCPTCSKWFSKRYHLKNHETIHAPDAGAQYPCPECTKCYSNRGNLERHVRVFHQQQRAYVCPECGKSFSQSSILKQHLAVHTSAKDWSCDLCAKRFKTREYLQLHRNRHVPVHPSQRKTAKATTATPTLPKKQRSATSTTAVTAPRTRTRAKQICHCQFCGKQSNSVALHVSHMRTHTGEKPYECELCHKRFSFQQSLKTHRLLHSGEKPYRCDECGQQFRQIGHLTGHRLTHSGRRQHACAYCPKAFALRGNLTVHMRMHTGETPYRCEWCGKKFNDSNGLKRHVVVHERDDARMGMEGAGGGVGQELEVDEELEWDAEDRVEEDAFSYSDVIAYESEEDGTTTADGDEEEEVGVIMMVAGEEGDRQDEDDETGAGMQSEIVDDGQMQDGYSVEMVDIT